MKNRCRCLNVLFNICNLNFPRAQITVQVIINSYKLDQNSVKIKKNKLMRYGVF